MTRLIDEEEAFTVLSAYYKHSTPVQDSALHDALSRVPTAVPVKRGVWLPTFEYHGFDDEVKNLALACSVCQVAFRISDYEQIEDFRYCPHCGAYMKGEPDAHEV